MRHPIVFAGLFATVAGCSNSSNGSGTTADSPLATTTTTAGTTGSSSPAPGSSSVNPPVVAPTGVNPPPVTPTAGGATGGSTSPEVPTGPVGNTGADSSGGPVGGSGNTSAGGNTGDDPSTPPGDSAGDRTDDVTGAVTDPDVGSSGPMLPVSSCVGEALPSADPKKAGPFQVAADKEVGPLAGVVPDPIYGDQQQRFNVYRPANLQQSGHCHPILIWANGYRDNPEQKPPDCVVDQNANRWCGQYSPMLNHLASHGFVVVASLSTATAEGDPLPTIAGLDWILEQAEDPASPYYHRLDTSNIGQLGHSYGGMSTCMSASEPRYKALATICGTRALSGVHTPMLFFCGGKDTTVDCDGVKNTYQSVTDQPAFFLNELNADHGSWVYQGAGGVSLSAAAAWFRAHLMGDAESRKFFYGPNCGFCTDNRVDAEQNALMAQ